jgi:hypothetical protein
MFATASDLCHITCVSAILAAIFLAAGHAAIAAWMCTLPIISFICHKALPSLLSEKMSDPFEE